MSESDDVDVPEPKVTEPKVTEPKPDAVKPDVPDTANLLSSMMEKLNAMETKIQATEAKPKTKRQASQKQLDNLAKARAKRNENMLKRKEIKKDLKIKEKKLVNDELERKRASALTPEPEPEPRSRATEPEVAPELEPPKQVEEKRQTLPQAPISVPWSQASQRQQPALGWTYSTRRYRRR